MTRARRARTRSRLVLAAGLGPLPPALYAGPPMPQIQEDERGRDRHAVPAAATAAGAASAASRLRARGHPRDQLLERVVADLVAADGDVDLRIGPLGDAGQGQRVRPVGVG